MDIGEFTRTILFPRRLPGANDRHKHLALGDTVAPRRPDVVLYRLEDDSFDRPQPPTIKVVSMGNGGCNAISRNNQRPIPGVDFLAVNTDVQSLTCVNASSRLLIGRDSTKGAGAGGNVETGLLAVEESRFELGRSIGNAEIVFVCAGLGGGTGTAGAPLVADIAKSAGALTIGVVTRPFSFEGEKRQRQADDGIARLRRSVDVLIVVSNDRLLRVCPEKATISEAFRVADDILFRAV